jgi:hypothetical protein
VRRQWAHVPDPGITLVKQLGSDRITICVIEAEQIEMENRTQEQAGLPASKSTTRSVD